MTRDPSQPITAYPALEPDAYPALLGLSCLLGVGLLVLAIWAQQGLPYADDWTYLYVSSGSPESLPIPPRHQSLFASLNDGVWPLVVAAMQLSWHCCRSLTPIVALNVCLVLFSCLYLLRFVRCRRGFSLWSDATIPLCFLNWSLLPSVTWSCLLCYFLTVPFATNLAVAFQEPARSLRSPAIRWGIVAFVVVCLGCGTASYTYGIGMLAWTAAAVCLLPTPAWRRFTLLACAVLGMAATVAIFTTTRDTHVAPITLHAGRFVKVLLQTGSLGGGHAGISTKVGLGAIVCVLAALAVWLRLRRVAGPGYGPAVERLLSAGSIVIPVMPLAAIAVARSDGLAVRYIPLAIPLVVWIHTQLTSPTGGRPGRRAAMVLCLLLLAATSFNFNAGLHFARQRHGDAQSLLSDLQAGIPSIVVAARHASDWKNNRDESFAMVLQQARGNGFWPAKWGEGGIQVTERADLGMPVLTADGWSSVVVPVPESPVPAQHSRRLLRVRYQPTAEGPFRIRWHVVFPDAIAPPAMVEEPGFHTAGADGRDDIRVDYFDMPPDAKAVWFGIQSRAGMDSLTVEFVQATDDMAPSLTEEQR